MSDKYLTTADIFEINCDEVFFGLVKECLAIFPETTKLSAVPVTGRNYTTYLPSGVQTIPHSHLDASWVCNANEAEKCEWGKAVAFVMSARAHLEAAFRLLTQQTWYGMDASAWGFSGVTAYLNSTALPNVIDAGGMTSNGCTSVFAVSHQHISYSWGNEGRIDYGDVHEMNVATSDGNAEKMYTQKIAMYTGLQVLYPMRLGRICNLDASHPLTDDLLDKLLAVFDKEHRPDALYMAKPSLFTLRDTRPQEKGQIEPLPTKFCDVPIYVTEAITNTEPVVVK